MNNQTIVQLSAMIKAYIGYEVNCSFREDEGIFVVVVLAVPKECRKSVRHSLYALDSVLFPDGGVSISVIPYSVEDTKLYFPEIWTRIKSGNCLDSVVAKYENDGDSYGAPVSEEIYLAA